MIKLLDTHQHLVYRDVANYSWAKDIPPLATDNFTVENYLKLTEGLGIGGTLFMETGVDDPDYQNEAKYVQKLSDNPNNGKIFIASSSVEKGIMDTTGPNISSLAIVISLLTSANTVGFTK